MDGEYLPDHVSDGQQAPGPTAPVADTGKEIATAGSPASLFSAIPPIESLIPPGTQQVLKELIDLPGQILPPETVYHLKNAGRESLLAIYSLWQNINRATGASGEKVRKHIEVE